MPQYRSYGSACNLVSPRKTGELTALRAASRPLSGSSQPSLTEYSFAGVFKESSPDPSRPLSRPSPPLCAAGAFVAIRARSVTVYRETERQI
jgi:hypothetical protein